MKKTIALLAATTALGVALGLPAFSAAQAFSVNAMTPLTALAGDDAQDGQIFLASGDDDEGDDQSRRKHKSSHDDDDDDDGEDDCEDDDDCGGTAANPAPAGTVAPPANGLFGTGAPPKAVTN